MPLHVVIYLQHKLINMLTWNLLASKLWTTFSLSYIVEIKHFVSKIFKKYACWASKIYKKIKSLLRKIFLKLNWVHKFNLFLFLVQMILNWSKRKCDLVKSFHVFLWDHQKFKSFVHNKKFQMNLLCGHWYP